eukprot:g33403.t1
MFPTSRSPSPGTATTTSIPPHEILSLLLPPPHQNCQESHYGSTVARSPYSRLLLPRALIHAINAADAVLLIPLRIEDEKIELKQKNKDKKEKAKQMRPGWSGTHLCFPWNLSLSYPVTLYGDHKSDC